MSYIRYKSYKSNCFNYVYNKSYYLLIVFIIFDFSNNQFQFVQEYHQIGSFDFYLGLDGLSIYFVLLTTIITPIALLSNWNLLVKM